MDVDMLFGCLFLDANCCNCYNVHGNTEFLCIINMHAGIRYYVICMCIEFELMREILSSYARKFLFILIVDS